MEIAAGMAAIGEFVVPAWIVVKSLALLKPEVPTSCWAVENWFSKSDCEMGDPVQFRLSVEL